MAGKSKIEIEIVGNASSAKRAFKDTKDAADKLVPSSLKADTHLNKLGDTLANRLPFGGNIAKETVGKITASLGGMGAGMTAGTAGAALLGAGLVTMAAKGVESQLKLTAEVRKYQNVTAASAEDSSRMASALGQVGIEASTGASAMAKFAKNIDTNASALEGLGVQIVKNKDGSVDMSATLANVAGQMEQSTSATERARLGSTAFGKGWVALTPILAKGKNGVQELYDEAGRSHEIFSKKDLDDGRKFEESMVDLQDAVESLQRGIGAGLVPVLTTLSNTLEPPLHALDEFNRATGAVDFGVKSMFGAMIPGGNILNAFGQQSEDAAEKTAALGDKADLTSEEEADLADATKALEVKQRDAAKAAEAQAKALDKIIESSITAISAILGLEGATDRSEDATAEYNAALLINEQQGGRNAAAAEDLRDKGLTLKDALFGQAQAALKVAEDQAAANGQTLTAGEKADILKLKLLELAGQVNGPVRSELQLLASDIRNLPDAKDIHVRIFTEGQRNIAEAKLAMRAGGGPVSKGASYVVGERGMEVFTPDANGTITPNSALRGGSARAAGGGALVGQLIVHASGQREGELAGQAVVDALAKFVRKHGPLPATFTAA